MAAIWSSSGELPSQDARFEVFGEFAAEMAELGPANFIYADSDMMIAHGHKRFHGDGIYPPGLHLLCRHCQEEPTPVEATGLSIKTEADSQDIVLFASVPLTDEAWTPLGERQLLAAKDGKIIKSSI